VIIIGAGCSNPKSYGTSDKEPLLSLPEERFIFCQDGKIFRERPSYPERNVFYFVTQLNQTQINEIKSLMGNKEISFSGSEYEIPEDVFPQEYPDSCLIEYNGCCGKTETINYNECEKAQKIVGEFINKAKFNVKENYNTLVEISIDKNMKIPVVDNDYAVQTTKLCKLPLSNGKPIFDNLTWKVGKEWGANKGTHIYNDIE
ncbi:hypothetical protein KKA94_03380, partial [Patescibacteria group bacterium]|nr:hypothetical protein [Patescibacteria group bacterium]